MKKLSKVLAVFLALLMAASLVCIPVSAETEPDPYASLKEGIGYLAIGDSFTRGYGATADRNIWLDQIYRGDGYPSSDVLPGQPGYNSHASYYCRNVQDSYPNRIVEHFGLKAPDDIRDTSAQFWPIAHDAVSTAYMLDLIGIDDNYRDDDFTYQDGSMLSRYPTDLRYFGCPESFNLEGTARTGQNGEIAGHNIRELISNAGLITLGVGQTDVIYRAQVNKEKGFNNMDLSDMSTLPQQIADLLGLLYEYYDYWKGAYPMLLDFIHENNPDAEVVIVGTMNPIQDVVISDEIFAPIGSAINFIADTMNAFMRECAKKYGYSFVDISNVDTPPSVKQMTLEQLLASTGDEIEYALTAHPTPEGYAQIARMIIDTVEKDLAKKAAEEAGEKYSDIPKTYIQYDIGNVDFVDYVTVNGKKVNFKLDGTVLTVPYNSAKGKVMVVGFSKNDATSMITYTLNYDSTLGYSVRRILKIDNVFDIINRIIKMVFEKMKALFVA